MLLERYNFSINMGGINEMTARRTLMFGMKNATELAYNCEDFGSAMVLQRKYESLRDDGAIPQPI